MRAAVEASEEECCGFLFGVDGEEGRRVCDMMPAPNVSSQDRRRTFEIGPSSYLEAESLAEGKGLELIGVYHSHPGTPAVPSDYDLRAAQPFFSYVIISVYNGKATDMRSWRLNADRNFKEEFFSTIELAYTFHGHSYHPNSIA